MSHDGPFAIGEVLLGKYRIEQVLGRGGMGVVVAATHIHLGERVALKFLLPDVSRRPDTVARFLREAQAAVRIKSEHVARISDVGILENGSPYMVMEFLSGSDLGEVLAKHGPLPPHVAVAYVLQACEAIAEAHALGIVHRDLKPSNLFLTRRADGSDLVKVLDFGISKAPVTGGPQDQSLTATQGMMGSPLYMSPEQVRSAKNVDARADVWSIGVILYELVSGRTPFVAETVSGLLAAIIADEPIPLHAVLPTASEALDITIGHCLEKDPRRRFGSVAELAAALAPFAPAARLSVDRVAGVLRANAPPSSDPTEIGMLPISVIDPAPLTIAGVSSTSPAIPLVRPAASIGPTRASADVEQRTGAGWGGTRDEGTDAPSTTRRRAAVLAMIGAAVIGGIAFVATGPPSGARSSASVAAPPPSTPSSAAVEAPPTTTGANAAATRTAPGVGETPAAAARPVAEDAPTSPAAFRSRGVAPKASTSSSPPKTPPPAPTPTAATGDWSDRR